MNDKKLTPQESMELISQMIDVSKRRVAMPDLRISIMWASLSIITAALVMTLCLSTGHAYFNWLWFAIPVIGLPLNAIMVKKQKREPVVKTYIDRITDGIWRTVGLVAIALTLICLAFSLGGHRGVWLAMFYYGFIIVGFGAAMQGYVLNEGSYVFGGIFSIIAGFVVIALSICQIPLLISWVLPLYMLCFLLMFIVPAFVIRRKLNRNEL